MQLGAGRVRERAVSRQGRLFMELRGVRVFRVQFPVREARRVEGVGPRRVRAGLFF